MMEEVKHLEKVSREEEEGRRKAKSRENNCGLYSTESLP